MTRTRAIKAIMAGGAIGAVAAVGYAWTRTGRHMHDDDPSHPTGAPAGPSGLHLPLSEPDHPHLRRRINGSQHHRGIVQQDPMRLLEQARRHDAAIDLDELAGARLAASEHSSGTFTELACIVDAELNRAERKGIDLFTSLTDRGRFGKQGGKRPASTRLDPRMRHLLAARAVIHGPARGVSRGAVRFFDPKAMETMHARYRDWIDRGRTGKKPAAVSCDAATLLEAWSFDYGKRGKNRCPPDRSNTGRRPLAWVGPIPGVDPLRLMLMKPMATGPEHTRQYQAARDTLRHGLRGKVA
jgi:hypothetical protein